MKIHFNFEQLENHHNQSNRKSNVTNVVDKDESFRWGTSSNKSPVLIFLLFSLHIKVEERFLVEDATLLIKFFYYPFHCILIFAKWKLLSVNTTLLPICRFHQSRFLSYRDPSIRNTKLILIMSLFEFNTHQTSI